MIYYDVMQDSLVGAVLIRIGDDGLKEIRYLSAPDAFKPEADCSVHLKRLRKSLGS